jgi:hypothetical protein
MAWPIFGLFSNRIFESNRIFYTYCNRVRIRRQSQSSEKKKVRDSTYTLRMSKNIRFEFETIFECRKIQKTLKFSNFESNIFSNPTPSVRTVPVCTVQTNYKHVVDMDTRT